MDGGVQWRDLNPARGVYNWMRMDAIVAAHPGKSIVFTLYGTPAFAVLHQSDLAHVDNWGSPGGAAASNYADLRAFVVALLTRYKGKLKAIEIWNEPQFKGFLPEAFFWGTAEELVQMGIAVRSAVNATDTMVEVWSPGFDFLEAMTTWLSAGRMTKGRDLIDTLAFHRYAFWQSLSDLNVITDYFGVQVIRKVMLDNGISDKDLVLSECGIAPVSADSRISKFAGLTAAQRYAYMIGFLLMLRAAGVTGVYFYAWDQTLCGDLITDAQGMCKAINDMAAV